MSDLALTDSTETGTDDWRLRRPVLASFVLIEAAWLIALAALFLHLAFKV